MTQVLEPILAVCRRHADRLRWAMQQLSVSVPFDAQRLAGLSDMGLAVLDQFTGRFARLQDVMEQSLFPAMLDRAQEPGDLSAFLEKWPAWKKLASSPRPTSGSACANCAMHSRTIILMILPCRLRY